MSWSDNILRLRERSNLTQKQLSEAVGVTVQTISNWETGRNRPRLDPVQMLALCQILQCSLEELADAMKKRNLENLENESLSHKANCS